MRKFLNIAVFVAACLPVQAQVQMLFSSDSLFNITSPLAIDSLFYWFDASQGVTDSLGGAIANNEGVGTWNDLSGHGYHVTQTTNTARPVYKTGALAGYPGIQFDGSNDFLAEATASWWGSDDITIIGVFKFASATRNANDYVICKVETVSPTNTRQWRLEGKDASVSYLIQWSGSDDGTSTVGPSWNYVYGQKSTTWKLHVVVDDNSGTVVYYEDGSSISINSGLSDQDKSNILNATIKLGIGAVNVTGGSPSNYFQGTMCEVMVWTKALSTAERTAMQTYFNRKYDIY